MKTCEEYILKQYLNQEKVISQKDKKIKELETEIIELKNPISEVVKETEKVDCLTLYKSANLIYNLRVNDHLYKYKEVFESIYANGKITIDELRKALVDDKELDRINNKFVIDNWSWRNKMYQFEPFNSHIFEFDINGIQYLIHGSFENLQVSRLNNFDELEGYFYEKYKDDLLKKAKETVRKTLQETIEYLATKEEKNNNK